MCTVQAVGGGLSGMAAQFSDESALEVCIHVMRYTNRRLYFFTFCTCSVGNDSGTGTARKRVGLVTVVFGPSH